MTGSEFAEAMVAAGIDPGTLSLIADGKIHRFAGSGDRPGKLNCWYVLFDHGGAFGSWRLGIQQSWHPNAIGDGKYSPQERRRIKKQIEAAKREAKAEREKLQEAAAVKAQLLWNKAIPISQSSEHFYLLRKHIYPHGARRLGQVLVIPIHDIESGEIVNLQFIKKNGEKRFLEGGRIAESFYACGYE